MHDLRFIKLLKTLSRDEMLRFGKYLRSPFYNYKAYLFDFYEALKRYYPEFEPKKLKVEKIWPKVFPDKAFNQNKFWRLCSDMNLMLEQYLIALEVEYSDAIQRKTLIDSLGRRQAMDLFDSEVKAARTALAKQPERDASWFKENMALNEKWYFHPQSNKFNKKDTSLHELLDSLDAYFILQKLKFGVAELNVQRIFKKEHPIRFLSLLDQELDIPFLESNVLFQLYKHSLALLQRESDMDLERVEELLFANLSILDMEDAKALFINGLNYALRKLNQGKAEYGHIVLKWYMKGIKEKIILDNGFLSEAAFQNIVQTSCRLKQFDFAKNFIEEYHTSLRKENQEMSADYARSIYYFNTGDYDKAIFLLLTNDWTKLYLLPGKNLLIRAIFEKYLHDDSAYYLLLNHLKNFEIFALTTKLYPKNRLEPHLNLVRLLKRLAGRIEKRKTTEEIQDWLAQQLEKKKKVISKEWLKKLKY